MAPALAVESCNSSSHRVNFSQPVSSAAVNEWYNKAPPLSFLSFMMDTSLDISDSVERINIVAANAPGSGSCAGELNLTSCTLRSAVGEYDVLINDGIITLGNTPPRILALSDNARVNHTYDPEQTWMPSTLGGVVQEMYNRFDGLVIAFSKGGTIQTAVEGTSFEIYAEYNPTSKCIVYRDPLESLIKAGSKITNFPTSYVSRTATSDCMGQTTCCSAWVRQRQVTMLRTYSPG